LRWEANDGARAFDANDHDHEAAGVGRGASNGVVNNTIAKSAALRAPVDGATLHMLSPPRRSDRYRAWPIRIAPFYALPICAAITNTMGSIVVDGNGAVLDQSDTSMPGLFAAGSTVGGLDGGPNAGYVGGLIKATIALRAAEAASSK
jgi:fumarate reductase flavoprotein subunit